MNGWPYHEVRNLDAEVYDRVPGSAITPGIVVFPRTPVAIRTVFGGGSQVQ